MVMVLVLIPFITITFITLLIICAYSCFHISET